MATGLRRIITDENASEKCHGKITTKVFKTTADKIPKRAALGELGNRAVVTNSLLSKIKEATAQESLKNAKAKVDSFWTNKDGRKLIRTDSLKSVKNTVTDCVVAGNKVTLRSTTTNKENRTVQQRPAIIKATRQLPAKKDIILKSTTVKKDEIVLRREESNLSKNTLIKLKAALTKDAAKREGSGATKTENGIAPIRKKPVVKQVVPVVNAVKIVEKVKIKEKTLPEPISVNSKTPKIHNIDCNDFDNIFALSEYVNDIYKYLNELEETFKIDENFMKNQVEVTPRMRSILLNWITEVAFQFRLLPETYQITVGIIDRYLQIVPNTIRGQLQLVGATALFIATKYEELYSSDINDFIVMTDNSYSKEEMIEMEKKIMRTLDFQLSRPIPIQFLRRYSKAIGADESEHFLAKYILELMTLEYHLAHYKPSEIAASAIYLSVQLLNTKNHFKKDDIWTATMEHYSGYSSKYLDPIVSKIAYVLKNAPKAKNKSIYVKHKDKKHREISLRPELYGKTIDIIIGSYKQN